MSRTFCKGSLQGIIFVQGLMTVCVAWIHLLPLTVQSSGEGWRGGGSDYSHSDIGWSYRSLHHGGSLKPHGLNCLKNVDNTLGLDTFDHHADSTEHACTAHTTATNIRTNVVIT